MAVSGEDERPLGKITVCPAQRYMSAGRVTQYEIDEIDPAQRKGWRNVWCSLSDEFHPTSELDWKLNHDGD